MEDKVKRSFIEATKWYNKNHSSISQGTRESFHRVYNLWHEDKPVLEIYKTTALDNIVISKEIFDCCVEWVKYTNALSEYFYEEYLRHL